MRQKIIDAVLFCVLFCSSALAQGGVQVTFQLNSPNLPPDTAVFITGGIEQLGNWSPAKVKMTYRGDHIWAKEVIVNAPASIEYKYTLGSWEREGASANGMPLTNLLAKITAATTIKDSILFWTKAAPQRVNQGQITGTVKYHRGMKGDGIADRDVIVWLPPDYDKEKKTRYPVLYMHDGQNIFDPVTSSFGVDWSVDETVDRLIKSHEIRPLIVVGIYNTRDRMQEYTPGFKGTAYMNFVIGTVKPFIDSTYRTIPDRGNTMVGGSSAGGLISFMLAWEHPDVFSKAICMSPVFKLRDIDYVKTVAATKEKKRAFFYIDNGGVGLETQLQPGIDEMLGQLKADGYKEDENFVFIQDPKAKHSEADWAKRFPNALKLVMRGQAISNQ